jgi:hypothetical protein
MIYYNIMVNILMCYSNLTIVNIYWHYHKLVYKIIVSRGDYKITYFTEYIYKWTSCRDLNGNRPNHRTRGRFPRAASTDDAQTPTLAAYPVSCVQGTATLGRGPRLRSRPDPAVRFSDLDPIAKGALRTEPRTAPRVESRDCLWLSETAARNDARMGDRGDVSPTSAPLRPPSRSRAASLSCRPLYVCRGPDQKFV